MLLKIAYLNLFRNKRRSFSTGLAICIGFVGLNLLGAYVYRVKKALDATAVYSALNGHVKIYKKDSLVQFSLYPKKYMLNLKDIFELEKIFKIMPDEIEYTGLNVTGSGLLSNGRVSHPVMFWSFEPSVYKKSLMQPDLKYWAPDWVLPEQFDNIQLFEANSEMMSLTPKIMDIMGLTFKNSAMESLQMATRNIDGDLNAINLDIGAKHTTGMQFLEDTLVLIPFKKAQELLGTDGSESVSVYLNKKTKLSLFKQKLDAQIEPLGLESYVYYDEKINTIYLGTIGFLIVMSCFVVFLIGTAVALTIINSLTMGIIERSREIGTLLALGFNKSHISKIFIIESLILCTISILIGGIFVIVISAIVNLIDIRFSPPGVAGAIQFKLVWNLVLAATLSTLTYIIVGLSALLVMKNRSRVSLINLLNDSGA